MTDVVELDDHTRTASTFRGGWLAYQEEKATARRHAEEAYAEYSATREALLGRAQRERQWSTTGYNRAKRHPPDNDKALRRFRMEASENLASKARQTEQALARLDEVDKPWEPWDLQLLASDGPSAAATSWRRSTGRWSSGATSPSARWT